MGSSVAVGERGAGRHPLRAAAGAAGAILFVAAVAAGGLYFWLGSYAPLGSPDTGFAPGPGVGAAVQPVTGSLGRTVYFPALRRSRFFDAAFTLHNGGRFAVTVTGLDPAVPGTPPWIGPVELLATASASASAAPSPLLPFRSTLLRFRSLKLPPGSSGRLVVRFALRCAGATAASPDVVSDRVRLRYRYLSLFRRTQTVRLPFAVTLRCVGGPPATP